jgi:hypothetical protein
MLPATLHRADPFAGSVMLLAVVSGLATATLVVVYALTRL